MCTLNEFLQDVVLRKKAKQCIILSSNLQMKINYKDLFREFEQTGFDPSRPQHDPTQAQNQSQTVNEDMEFNADGK